LINSSGGALAMMQGVGGKAKGAMSAAVMVNLAINAVLNLGISFLWTMMNTLQIIVHMPLININFPSNAATLSILLF